MFYQVKKRENCRRTNYGCAWTPSMLKNSEHVPADSDFLENSSQGEIAGSAAEGRDSFRTDTASLDLEPSCAIT